MAVGFDQYLRQLKRANVIESTIANFLAYLAKLSCQNVDNLAQSSDLERFWCDSKDAIVHIEKLFFTQVCCGQEVGF